MMPIRNPRKCTPLGVFMNEYCRGSETGLMIMNEDYLIYDWKLNCVMIFEEKCGDEPISKGQRESLTKLYGIHNAGCAAEGIDFWGIFIIRLPAGRTHVGPGIKLNMITITVEELVRHVNFEKCIVPGWNPRQVAQQSLDVELRKELRNGHP